MGYNQGGSWLCDLEVIHGVDNERARGKIVTFKYSGSYSYTNSDDNSNSHSDAYFNRYSYGNIYGYKNTKTNEDANGNGHQPSDCYCNTSGLDYSHTDGCRVVPLDPYAFPVFSDEYNKPLRKFL